MLVEVGLRVYIVMVDLVGIGNDYRIVPSVAFVELGVMVEIVVGAVLHFGLQLHYIVPHCASGLHLHNIFLAGFSCTVFAVSARFC